MIITGEGGRIHAVEQEASARHLADELRRDLAKWVAPPGESAEHVRIEVGLRIGRLLATANEYRDAIDAYDARRVSLTPGEMASFYPRKTA